ncbi:MAG: DUF4065 domain-containing protein [Ruminococcaceae bacterium]|nr:DUF4065 domain-containing protein [Oscillospiraceae bacterium]
MCKSIEVGKHILNFCIKNKYEITPSKIQKLLYYMQGYFYAKNNENMFDEKILAWDCGPAIPEVNAYFTKYIHENKGEPIVANLFLSDAEKEVFKFVCEKKSVLSTNELIEITQKETPWVYVYKDGVGKNDIITNEHLKKWFGGI